MQLPPAQQIVKISASAVLMLLLLSVQQLTLAQNSTSSNDNKSEEDLKTTQVTRARGGRMLDLDVLAGDIGKDEKAAKSISGARQSRTMSELDKVEGRSPSGGGATTTTKKKKKMAINGFIPIVSLEGGKHFDPSQLMGETEGESESDDSEQGEAQANNLREHLATNYGGQTSIGHASFAPTAEQQQQQQWQQAYSNQDTSESARATRKLLGSSHLLSGLTGSSKRGGLVASALGQQSQYPMNLPPVGLQQAQQLSYDPTGECICVPFFQCKSGFLSESQLSKSQLMQASRLIKSPTTNQLLGAHQIPRSLSMNTFKPTTTQQQDLYYATQQQPQQSDQQQQQQFVNDLIYDQLQKSIESANLEQQLAQQEAYQAQNQQHLALIDERQAVKQPSANATTTSGELEERSLLNSLQTRRQSSMATATAAAGTRSCGIMRTCCRLPPRVTRNVAAPLQQQFVVRPPQAARFVHQTALMASPSISRPNQLYQRPPLTTADLSYQTSPNPFESYPPASMALGTSSLSATRPLQQQQQPSGAFMMGRCGQRQTLGISGRVQNSDQQHLAEGETSAEFGEFPAHAAILKRLSPGDSLFVCSAVLISGQWLATAAHCVRKSRPEELKVRLGEWDVNRDDEFYPHFESNVREIVLHPDFQSASLINDIALLRLEQPVDAQQMPHIAPACLATPLDSTLEQQQPRCWVAGWGKDAFGQQGAFQSVLKKVDLPVVSHGECESALRYQTKLGKHFRLHSSNICAGGERGKDACEGDGGAGLYCVDPASGLSKAVGLVSWGVGCGQRGVPGVYVSLAHFNSWIESVVVASGEENVYLDARGNGSNGQQQQQLNFDAQNFKNIISERSNQAVNASSTPAPTTISMPTA